MTGPVSGAAVRPVVVWAVPRSRSTALARVMIERGDLEVVHEPFSYLAAQGVYQLAGRELRSAREILDVLLEQASAGRRFFVKETTDYRYDDLLADERFAADLTHAFMIRHPADAIASHHAMNSRLTSSEAGFAYLAEILDQVRAGTGRTPIVIDGDDLVAEPDAMVEAFCRAVGLPHVPEALTWQPGGQPVWEQTAAWHRDVEQSTGLSPRRRTYDVDAATATRLQQLVDEQMPHYDRLAGYRLRTSVGGAQR
ncbi:sulfotransferase family protein [Kribbella soli]|uniref:Sulfotransferase family protein n=1 Tax=Kribbella soli TaxID=1124743 RepID=A0A4R0H9Y1_9ACTN|nr:sulfotransferase family protein [Kribbella soli]TCC06324.1 sulfotransferase family protein [Kribbella soli]